MKKCLMFAAIAAMLSLAACSSTPKETETPADVPAATPTAEEIAAAEAEKVAAEAKEEIKVVVSENAADLRGCYESVLSENKDLAGKYVLSWKITTTGEVADVTIKEKTIDNVDLEDCIVNTVKTWKFLERNNDVAVDYPFEFSPTAPEAAAE